MNVSNQSFALLKIVSKTVPIMDFQCIMLAAPKNHLGSKNVKSFKYVVLRKYTQQCWIGSNRLNVHFTITTYYVHSYLHEILTAATKMTKFQIERIPHYVRSFQVLSKNDEALFHSMQVNYYSIQSLFVWEFQSFI